MEPTLTLPVSQATPLALIVNELVVNSARHAFPDGRGGTVRLELRRAAPGLGELVVADDGIGVPEPPARNTPEGCLGLHLVPRLARQAHASLRMENDRRHAGDPALRLPLTQSPAPRPLPRPGEARHIARAWEHCRNLSPPGSPPAAGRRGRTSWPCCAPREAGQSALLVAPTGGGKTLAGFLPSLIDLHAAARGPGRCIPSMSRR